MARKSVNIGIWRATVYAFRTFIAGLPPDSPAFELGNLQNLKPVLPAIQDDPAGYPHGMHSELCCPSIRKALMETRNRAGSSWDGHSKSVSKVRKGPQKVVARRSPWHRIPVSRQSPFARQKSTITD